MWLPEGKKSNDMFSRFDRIGLPVCDGHTDGHTSYDSDVGAIYCIAR